jgi:hypothetical protein
MKTFRDMCVKYDKTVLSGLKTYLTIAVLAAAFLLLPESKLQYFVTALGIGHLFVIVEAKRSA